MAFNRIRTLDKTKMEWMMIHSAPQSLNRRSHRQRSSQEAALLHIAVQISQIPSSCGAFVLQSKEKLKGFWVPNQHGVSQEVLFLMCIECAWKTWEGKSVLGEYCQHILEKRLQTSSNLYLYLVYLMFIYVKPESWRIQISIVSFKNHSLPISCTVVTVIVSY